MLKRRNWLMDFCSKCGSRLTPKKVASGSQVTLVFACSKCGHKTKESAKNVKLNGLTVMHNPKQLVAVIEKEKQLSTLPTIQVTCPRCGNNNAYAWQVQTRGADESSTQFLRCTSCNYTFRENT
jgi:DNA-directed RNA polymerase subunit M